MNNSISLGLFILEISKIIRYELWYDYVKAKYRKNAKKKKKNTDSIIVYIKT